MLILALCVPFAITLSGGYLKQAPAKYLFMLWYLRFSPLYVAQLLTIAIYEQIATVVESQKIQYFIISVTARDLILHYGYGIEVR